MNNSEQLIPDLLDGLTDRSVEDLRVHVQRRVDVGVPHQLRDDLSRYISPGRLSAAFAEILQDFRQRYVISYSPRGVNARGWHKVDLRVKGGRATVKVRAGYLAGPD